MALLALASAGCATNPKQTVMNLDTTDRKWASRRCIAARREVFRFNDHYRMKVLVGVAGNLIVPFAGTGASLALTGRQQKEREALNARVLDACVTDRRKAEVAASRDRHRLEAAFSR